MSEEEERSSGDETIRHNQRRGRRSGQRIRKEGRRRGEEAENLPSFPKMSLNQRTGSPIMTECTAAMVLMDLSGSPAGRVSHASGQSGMRTTWSDSNTKIRAKNLSRPVLFCSAQKFYSRRFASCSLLHDKLMSTLRNAGITFYTRDALCSILYLMFTSFKTC